MSRFINKFKAYLERFRTPGSGGSGVMTAITDSLVRSTSLELELHDAHTLETEELVKLIMQYPYVVSYSLPIVNYGPGDKLNIKAETIGERSHDMKKYLEQCLHIETGNSENN